MTRPLTGQAPTKCIAVGCGNPAIGGPADRGSSRYCRSCITAATKLPDPDFYPSAYEGVSISESLRRP